MKVFYLTLAISLLLIIGGFLLPPMGIIDGSVLTAVGELLMFGVLAQEGSDRGLGCGHSTLAVLFW